MEQSTQSADGATQEAHGKTEGMTEAEFEKAKVDGIAYETHQKALKQRAKFKEDNEALKAKLESYRQKELEDEGKYKELVDSQRRRISELEETNNKMSRNFQWNVVGAQIKSEFAARKVRNPDKALKYALAAHREDLNMIEVDDQYNVNSDDLKRFTDKFLNDNVDMGFVSKVGVKDMTPGASSSSDYKELPEDVTQLSKDEILARLKE